MENVKMRFNFSYIIITHDSTNGLWKFVKFCWLDEWQDVVGWLVHMSKVFVLPPLLHPSYDFLSFLFDIILPIFFCFNIKFNWHLFFATVKVSRKSLIFCYAWHMMRMNTGAHLIQIRTKSSAHERIWINNEGCWRWKMDV